MRRNAAAFGAGALFALGLAVSGMTQPQKVIGFLDVTGAWDPSLAFVMLGALCVHVVLLRVGRRRAAPVFAPAFRAGPAATPIDGNLLAGSAIFGIGWGLSGYCPGPGFVAAGGLSLPALGFVAAMSAGMLVFQAIHQRRRREVPPLTDAPDRPAGV